MIQFFKNVGQFFRLFWFMLCTAFSIAFSDPEKAPPPISPPDRRTAIGFGPVTIPPGGGEIQVKSGEIGFIYRGTNIINTGDSDGLYIKGLWVGNISQIPTGENPISVICFDPAVRGNDIEMDACSVGLQTTFSIVNMSDTPKRFSATILSDVVEEKVANTDGAPRPDFGIKYVDPSRRDTSAMARDMSRDSSRDTAV